MNRRSGSPQLHAYFDDGRQGDSGEELEPFDFGEEKPTNSRAAVIPNEDEYDAINEETFGFAEPITSVEGLDVLAEQTKLLELADIGGNDFAWPDPSTIPLPSAFQNLSDHNSSNFAAWVENTDLRPSTSVFGNNDLFMFADDPNFSDTKYKFTTEDDLYRKMAIHWDPPSELTEKPATNSILDLFTKKDQLKHEPDLLPQAFQQIFQRKAENVEQKPKILTEAMLLKLAQDEDEELSRNKPFKGRSESPALSKPPYQMAAQTGFTEPDEHYKQHFPPLNASTIPKGQKDSMNELWSGVPPPKPTNFYQNTQPPGFQQRRPPNYSNNFQRNPNFPMPPMYQFQPPPPINNAFKPNSSFSNQPPRIPPPPMNGINPTVMNLMKMHLNQHNQPPPGFPLPPIPNQFPSNFNGPMFPPPPFSPMSNMLAHQRNAMNNSMRGSNSSLCSSRTKKPFLPSTKTISDFAFDPYAGLMSKKEREWLIKIQLIQCMVSGDQIEDDYYYTVWKERNVLAKAPLEWRVTLKPQYYNFDNTYPSDRYVPPVFNGSLGRPTHSSTRYARQIIDLEIGSLDDDVESSAGAKSISQKKLRAILLRIENASLGLLECRDFLYKTSKIEMSELDNKRAMSIVSEKIQGIIDCVAGPNELPTVMLVQKGRYLIGQLITYSDDSQASEIMTTLVKATPRFAHRIPTDSNNQPLLRAIISKLRNMDLYTYKLLRETLPLSESLEPSLELSPFVQQLCLTFMIGLCGREIPLTDLLTGPIGTWLADNDAKRFQSLIPVFDQEAVDFDLIQLYHGLSYFPPNSIGRQVAEILKTRIKQRPS